MKKEIFSNSTLICILIIIIAIVLVPVFKPYYRQKAIDAQVAKLEAAEAAGEMGEMNQTGYVDHVIIKDEADISENVMEKLQERALNIAEKDFPNGYIVYDTDYFNYRETAAFRYNNLVIVYKVTDACYSQSFYYGVEFEDVKIDSEDDIECSEYVLGLFGEGDIELEGGNTVFSSLSKLKAAIY